MESMHLMDYWGRGILNHNISRVQLPLPEPPALNWQRQPMAECCTRRRLLWHLARELQALGRGNSKNIANIFKLAASLLWSPVTHLTIGTRGPNGLPSKSLVFVNKISLSLSFLVFYTAFLRVSCTALIVHSGGKRQKHPTRQVQFSETIAAAL